MNPEDIPLRDLHLPADIGWWPLAPGWWVGIAFVAVLLAFAAWRAFSSWRRNAARRLALKRFAAIRDAFEQGEDAVTLGIALSELLRRSALAYAPRADAAGLTGDAWLAWLDRGLPERPFSAGPGRLLESLPYMNPARVDNDTDVAGLIRAVRLRLSRPFPEVAA